MPIVHLTDFLYVACWANCIMSHNLVCGVDWDAWATGLLLVHR